MRTHRGSSRFFLLLPLLTLACGHTVPSPRVAPSATTAAGPFRSTNDLHWLRSSAEYRAITIETYRAALAAAGQASAGRPAGSWAVSVDADDTIIDNSTYQVELERKGLAHSDAAWKAWVQRRERTAVPGAATFMAGVQKLGGRVAVVTNTEQSLCGEVAANLDALKLPYDLLVCRPDGAGDRKEPRWQTVTEGTARPDLGPLEILVFVGDNIQDFPYQSQALRDKDETAFADFGVRFFALPNPVYGTWEKNQPR